jgi:thiamine kinase-like enzyme
MSENHLTILQHARKREFLRAVAQLETLHQEPEELDVQLNEGRTVQARKYIKKFDAATLRVLTTFFRYMSAMERPRR